MSVRLAASVIVAALAALAPAARADQCYALTRDQAEAAAKVVLASPTNVLAAFCAPCGDTGPNKLVRQTVEVKTTRVGPGLFINGAAVDLAYVYYPVGNGRYRNLAMAASCKVQLVPEFVTMK
jgi:hypothetical protein